MSVVLRLLKIFLDSKQSSHEITAFTYQVGLDFSDLILSASKESGASLEGSVMASGGPAGLAVCVSLENVYQPGGGVWESPQDHPGNGFGK